MWILELEKLVLYAKWHVSLQTSWSLVLFWNEQGICLGLPPLLTGISICLPKHAHPISWFWHMVLELIIYHLEYDNIEPTMRDDCLCKSRIHGHLHVSKQKKKKSKNGFSENVYFFKSTNISCGQTHECFICKLIYQMFPFCNLLPLHKHSCCVL